MRRLLGGAVVTWLAMAAGTGAQAPAARIWEGVYTAAQAERGKATYDSACIRCHGGDLAGTTAPALKGERFTNTFGGETVSRLFEKIRDTMPPNFSTTLDNAAKIEIVAYILQTNGFPTGERDLAPGAALASIQILGRGEQPRVQNFSLVQAVGCLAREKESWVLRRASEPLVTTADTPNGDALGAAASVPLGTGSLVLLSAGPFDPAAQAGRKVEARGLIYRDAAETLLTVTSLRALGSCN